MGESNEKTRDSTGRKAMLISLSVFKNMAEFDWQSRLNSSSGQARSNEVYDKN